jgi:predicted outer membrane repeat protein
MALANPPRLRCANHPSFRPQLEHLEDRSVPATFNVTTTLDDLTPANGKFSVREAITKANTTPGTDVIILPAGVFKITLVGTGDNANATGDFDITDAVTIQGAGAGVSIVDAQQLDRVFDVFGSVPSAFKAVFKGLTIRNGNLAGPGEGGGIQVGNANLVVRDCIVSANRASGDGGGISNGALPGTANVTLVNTSVARNVAGGDGGGLFVGGASTLAINSSAVRRNASSGAGGGVRASSATLTNCTVSGNSAVAEGGGINAGTATLTSSTVSGNNTATGSGGGINAGTATLTNSTISGNTADAEGGGVRASTATLTNSTVSGNTAASGGGIFAGTATLTRTTVSGNNVAAFGGGINASTATLTNSTVSGNTAQQNGGGLSATTATLLNCTIADNIAQSGGGLFHVAGGTFSVKNTIVALNLVVFGGIGTDVAGATFTSQGHNLIGDGSQSTGFTNGNNGDLVGTSANPIDPKLGPLANNGGPTKTMALLAGSRAIDHGDNAGVPATDQRGFPRKKDGNGDGIAVVDIGAVEK